MRTRIGLLALLVCLIFTAAVSPAFAERASSVVRTYAVADPLGVDGAFTYTAQAIAPDGRVVYATQYRADEHSELAVFDPITDKTTLLAQSAFSRTEPEIWGDYVVFFSDPTSSRDDTPSVHALNLKTGVETTISAGLEDSINNLRIYGTTVAWIETEGEDQTVVWTCDLAKKPLTRTRVVGPEAAFPDGGGGFQLPAGSISNMEIWGGKLVFDRSNSADLSYDVWMLDLAYLDSPPMLLSGPYSIPGNRNLLTDFEGQFVTWFAEAIGPDGTAIVCNVTTGDTAVIEESARAEIAGTKLVWLADDGDLMLHDLFLDEDLEITGDTGQPVWSEVLPSAIGRRFLIAQWAGPGLVDLGFGTILEPDVTATTAKSTVAYGSKPRITGTVRDLGLPVGDGAVHLQYSYDGINWNEPSAVATGRTTSTGTFSITVPMAVTETIRWRAIYDGLESDDGRVQHLSSASNTVKVTSPMVLSAPSRPSGARHGVYFKTTGTCKPGLDEGVKWLRVQAYKYERGKWRYKSSWYAYGAMISGKPGYRASVKPSSAGTWKLRAYWPSSTSHPATYGPWCRSFTVK